MTPGVPAFERRPEPSKPNRALSSYRLGAIAERLGIVCHGAVIAWQMFGERADGDAHGFAFAACVGERQSQDGRNGVIQLVRCAGLFGA